MKKLFVSQPMRDKTEEQILGERTRAVKEAQKELGEDVEIIDSYFKEYPSMGLKGDVKSVWCLGKSIALLAQADIAYFVKGWQNYRGCRIEHAVCKEYKITTIEE